MSRPVGVTRHLTYAWVEYGHTGDGQAFAAGLEKLGWRNIARLLPRKRDSAGTYFACAANPILPIRWKGRCRMILPNAVVDTTRDPRPYVDDPLLKAARLENEAGFRDEVAKHCEFLSKWVLSPGVVKDEKLTFGSDATENADLVACSGHGSGGTVWGGDYSLGSHLHWAIGSGADTHSDRLKYMLIPTCYNLSGHAVYPWISLMRRPNPVHGIFGYSGSYPGGGPGRTIFQKFAENLGKNGGRMKILDAFEAAHTGYLKERWGALSYTSSRDDTMRDWLAGKLATPATDAEIRWYSGENWPTGEVVVPLVPLYTARFCMGSTRIDSSNRLDPSVGLFPGEAGHLELQCASGFSTSDELTIVFYYYRPEKDGFDLERLLQIGTTPAATVTVLRDENKRDGTTHADALRVRPVHDGLTTIEIPYTVHPEAHLYYKPDGANAHGYFWNTMRRGTDAPEHAYAHGAVLRTRSP